MTTEPTPEALQRARTIFSEAVSVIAKEQSDNRQPGEPLYLDFNVALDQTIATVWSLAEEYTQASLAEEVRKVVSIADDEDSTFWQRGFRSCADRVNEWADHVTEKEEPAVSFHTRILNEIHRRLTTVNLVSDNFLPPWSGDHEGLYSRDFQVIAVGQHHLDSNVAQFLKDHDPSDAILRYEHSVSLLNRHWDNDGQCEACWEATPSEFTEGVKHPCPEVKALAISLKIEVPDDAS